MAFREGRVARVSHVYRPVVYSTQVDTPSTLGLGRERATIEKWLCQVCRVWMGDLGVVYGVRESGLSGVLVLNVARMSPVRFYNEKF